MKNDECLINISLDIASINDYDELKGIMYNEEIREKEKQGLNFNRRFNIFAALHHFRRFVRIVFKREIVLLCLKKNGIICGGLIADINLSEKKAGIGYVSIKEKNRGRGLGTILIKETQNYLKTKGVKKIELSTNQKNEIAIKLYLKNNFQIDRTPNKFCRKDHQKKILCRVSYKFLFGESYYKAITRRKSELCLICTLCNSVDSS